MTYIVKDAREHGILSGTIASYRETYDHRYAPIAVTPASGTLTGAPIPVLQGESYGHVAFTTSSTAAVFGSNNDGHWYVCVYDNNGNLVTQTADQGITAIPAQVTQALALQSVITPAADALYSAFLMIYTGTGGAPVQPTLKGSAATLLGSPVSGLPRTAQVANAGLTTGVAPGAVVVTGSPVAIPWIMLYT